MDGKWNEIVTGPLEQKKRYREYKARIKALPAPYRTAAEGLDRYLTYAGALTKAEVILSMLDDLVDLFEQGAAAETPVRDIVGDDPAAFADLFLQNYSGGQWVNPERARLVESVDRAVEQGRAERGAEDGPARPGSNG